MEKIKAYLLQHHNPEAVKAESTHVARIWEDGEVTMTKSGSLFGSRLEHMIEAACMQPLPLDVFPCNNGKHAFIFVAYEDIASVLAGLKALVAEVYFYRS